ncbi:MAG: SEC-C domain-containing protein [Thermoanaerobaculia bacterium]|nr:SEC-C domain-containing protein [Thermoanaerobaculia bacterium]
MRAVGRNDPCPCRSGLKYKKCCGMRPPSGPSSGTADGEALRRHLAEVEARRLEEEGAFGRARPPVSAEYQGYRFVAVGSVLHYYRASDVRTFADFLRLYLYWCLGQAWLKEQDGRPAGRRHPLRDWMSAMHRQLLQSTADSKGVVLVTPTGSTLACLLLSYDLFTLRDNTEFQRRGLERLRLSEHFQGTRQELFAAAVCVRAGFRLSYENEKDGTRRHPEFVALDRDTGVTLTVEAKSRRRPGVMGHPGEATSGQLRADVRRLLSEAVEQQRALPHVIFIDLNLPPSADLSLGSDLASELRATVDSIEPSSPGAVDRFNLVVFSNFPLHYVADRGPAPPQSMLAVLTSRPENRPASEEPLRQIVDQVRRYGAVPRDFPKPWTGRFGNDTDGD